jgi:undecaprenyl-diphosphatase
VEWLHRFDLEAFRAIHVGWHSPILDVFGFLLSWSGLGILQFLAALPFLRWESTKRFVVPVLVVIVVSGVPVAQGLKNLVPRDRPSNLAISNPQEHIFYSSFPSGHTTTSFAIAALLLLMTWKTPSVRWGWIALAWAACVGLSRIYRGVHWPTDVLAGACAGIFSAGLVYLLLTKYGYLSTDDTSPQAA